MGLFDRVAAPHHLPHAGRATHPLAWRPPGEPDRWAVLLLWSSLAVLAIASALLASSYLLPPSGPG